mgnify:CR=1 FL=1
MSKKIAESKREILRAMLRAGLSHEHIRVSLKLSLRVILTESKTVKVTDTSPGICWGHRLEPYTKNESDYGVVPEYDAKELTGWELNEYKQIK